MNIDTTPLLHKPNPPPTGCDMGSIKSKWWAADRVWGGGRGQVLLGGIIPPSFHAHPWHSPQTCSGPDSPKPLGFLCNLWLSLHQQLGCSARIREIIQVKELIVVARSGRKQFGGRAGVPRTELLQLPGDPQGTLGDCAKLHQAQGRSPVTSEAPVCHKTTFYQPILLCISSQTSGLLL